VDLPASKVMRGGVLAGNFLEEHKCNIRKQLWQESCPPGERKTAWRATGDILTSKQRAAWDGGAHLFW
jgi:hypothetical protein